jgi:small conductance mechanosensitive channel
MEPNLSKMSDVLTTTAIDIAIKVVAAFVFWVIGRWLIGVAVRMLQRVLTKQHVDPTLLRYLGNVVSVTLNIILVV